MPSSHRSRLWQVTQLGALLSNLLYVAGLLVAASVLGGLGGAPWRAYFNVLTAMAVIAATLLLNVSAACAGLTAAASTIGVMLNLACLGYLVAGPEYAIPAIGWLAALVPLLNVFVILSTRRRTGGPRPTGGGGNAR